MSVSAQKGKAEAQADRLRSRADRKIELSLKQLEDQFNRLKERVIPAQPYLLSVPSDVPYRYNSHFPNTWYNGTPFSASEEQLQYVSFLPHQSDHESLLKVVGGWADEKGHIIEEDSSPQTAPVSGRNTPLPDTSARKKISLKDYKTKDKTQPSTPTPKPPPREPTSQAMKNKDKEHAVKVEDGPKSKPHSTAMGALAVNGEKARPKETRPERARSPERVDRSRKDDVPSPRKRRRMSSPSPDRKKERTKVAVKSELPEVKDLPPMLSPTLPAQDNKDSKVLPDLLSPALPPALERAIAKANGDTGGIQRSEAVRSLLESALGSPADRKVSGKSPRDAAGRIRSDSQQSTKSVADSTKPISALKAPVSAGTPVQNGVRNSPGPRQSHRVVLKYGKKNAFRVKALLRFPPKRTKPKAEPEEALPKTREQPSSTKHPVVDSTKSDKKRVADASPERPAKKQKAASSLLETPEKAKTPNLQAAKSPSIPQSTQKLRVEGPTPRKELKSAAMKRIESTDGMDVRTPQVERARTSTPVNGSTSNQPKASPGPTSSHAPRDPNRAIWTEMNSKYFELGRTLKREGTSINSTASADRTEHDQALSVVLLIEAHLCFMINLAAQSHARPNVDPGWSTILPYHIFVFRASRKFRHLHGLVIQLGAVCRQFMHHLDIDKLARDPLPDERCGSAPTPGSDGTTAHAGDVDSSTERYKRKYIEFRNGLVQNARELQSAWLEGMRYLSPYNIERDYPRTWSRRTLNMSNRGSDKADPHKISREYFVPLDANSTTFEVVRFALAFLEEWTEREKIDWKTKIDL